MSTYLEDDNKDDRDDDDQGSANGVCDDPCGILVTMRTEMTMKMMSTMEIYDRSSLRTLRSRSREGPEYGDRGSPNVERQRVT